MFNDTKYSKVYYRIVKRARTRRLEGYYEVHHIIPKSLGGSDEVDNLVKLTAREHFICHRLLTKMTTGSMKKKMIYAAFLMMYGRGSREFVIRSRTYSQLCEAINTARKGTKHSLETKEKIGKGNRGKIRTQETKDKQSKAARGRLKSEDTKRKMSEYWSGRPRQKHTEETRQQISEKMKGRPATKGRTGMASPMLGQRHTDESISKMKEAQSKIETKICIKCLRSFRPCNYPRHKC